MGFTNNYYCLQIIFLLLLLLLLLVCHSAVVVEAQTTTSTSSTTTTLLLNNNNNNNVPNPNFTTTLFNNGTSFRQNICHLHEQYANNSIELADALQGFSIRAALNCPRDYCFVDQDGNLNDTHPGLYAYLLDNLAERARFDWRSDFVLIDPNEMPPEKSFTDLLEWKTETYDLAVSWWTKTSERVRMGIDFPDGWYDSSIILVGKKELSSSSSFANDFEMFSFLDPFQWDLWLMIVITIILSGLIYWLLEKLDPRSDKRRLDQSPIENMFITGVAFTTHFEFTPRTNIAWAFALSVSFWAMIVGSAYTANLASFLVVQQTPKLQITSVEDAVAYGKRICVYKGTAIADTLTKHFRHGRFVRKEDLNGSLQGVLEGDCTVAAVAMGVWQTWRRHSDWSCQLEWIGRKYKDIPAGFATRHDAGEKCTSLISEVMDIHLMDMLDDGTIQRLWEDHLKTQHGEPQCRDDLLLTTTTTSSSSSSSSTKGEEDGEDRLSLQNMGGIFIFHYMVSILALLLALYGKWSGRNQQRDEKLELENRQRQLEKLKNEQNLQILLERDPAGMLQQQQQLDDSGDDLLSQRTHLGFGATLTTTASNSNILLSERTKAKAMYGISAATSMPSKLTATEATATATRTNKKEDNTTTITTTETTTTTTTMNANINKKDNNITLPEEEEEETNNSNNNNNDLCTVLQELREEQQRTQEQHTKEINELKQMILQFSSSSEQQQTNKKTN